MNANDSLERGIADVYEREAPPRAPDWVLASVLDAIDTTPQRRVLIPAPWRFRHMNTFAKAAIAAVVVIAIGAVGLTMFSPRNSSVGGQPSASPSASPSISPDPSAPPPLSETFTSSINGISLSYPAGWETQAATEPWAGGGVNFREPQADVVYDRSLTDHLFLLIASRPLGAQSPEAWIDSIRDDPDGGCADPQTVAVDGADARLCSSFAYTSAGGRAYMIRLYTSGDEPWLADTYDASWFKSVLETVRLRPDDAVDTPSSSASPTN